MMTRRRRQFSTNLFVLIILGGIASAVFLLYDAVITRLAEQLTATPFAETLAVVSPVPTVIPPNAMPNPASVPAVDQSYAAIDNASLFIPSAGILAPVIQVYLNGTSWDVSELGTYVGHLQGTNWLDDGIGNIVLSAHVELRDGRAGAFATLDEIQLQDRIVLRQGSEERIYKVVDIRNVEPDDLSPLYPTTTDRLTLITCDMDTYDFLTNTYRERVVVVAERVS